MFCVFVLVFLQSVRKAEFTLGSTLSDNLEGFTLDNLVTISLGFKSTENKGLILRNKQQVRLPTYF